MNQIEQIIDDTQDVLDDVTDTTDDLSNYFFLPQRKITQFSGRQIHGEDWRDDLADSYEGLSSLASDIESATGLDNITNETVKEWLVEEPVESSLIVATGTNPDTGEKQKPDTGDVADVVLTGVSLGSSPLRIGGFHLGANLLGKAYEEYDENMTKKERNRRRARKMALILSVIIALILIYESTK